MDETRVNEDFRFRRFGGGVLIAIGLPLTCAALFLGVYAGFGFREWSLLLPVPCLLLFGIWGAFPRRDPTTRILITDESIIFSANEIPMRQITQIRHTRPIHVKHDRLTFVGENDEVVFDVVHLTHEARDIINLVGVRLEKQNKHLVQRISEVMGAQTGVWDVREGVPFEVDASSGMKRHRTE